MKEFSEAFGKQIRETVFLWYEMLRNFFPWEEFFNAVPREKNQCCKISVNSHKKLLNKMKFFPWGEFSNAERQDIYCQIKRFHGKLCYLVCLNEMQN